MNLSHPSSFVAGPLPRASLAPKGAPYSGLLECPLTTRVKRRVERSYHIATKPDCNPPILSAEECFAAGKLKTEERREDGWRSGGQDSCI